MAISALPEQGEPVFEIGDGCASIVKSGTGTSAGMHCDWPGRNDACWVVCCERRCAGMGENTGKRAQEQCECCG